MRQEKHNENCCRGTQTSDEFRLAYVRQLDEVETSYLDAHAYKWQQAHSAVSSCQGRLTVL